MIPKHALSFDLPIYRVIPAFGTPWLIVETRDPTTKASQCRLFKSPDYQLILPKFAMPDPWWYQLYDTWADLLLVHSYPEPGLPLVQGISAYQLPTGSLLWQRPTLRAVGLSEAGIHAIDPAFPNDNLLLSPQSGQTVRAQIKHPAPSIHAFEDQRAAMRHGPQVVLKDDSFFIQHQAALQALLGAPPVLQLEALDLGSAIWAHCYLAQAVPHTEVAYQGHLVRFQNQSWELISGPHPRAGLWLDAYFVEGTWLYFLANKHQLDLISLTP